MFFKLVSKSWSIFVVGMLILTVSGKNPENGSVETDGFIIPGKAEFTPHAWQIAAPIK